MTLVLSGTNGISAVDGSAAAPSIVGTDSNTGVFFPAADTVAIATGGSERARIDSSGRVLIGLTSSAGGTNGAALQVKGLSGSSDFSIALMDNDTTVAGRLHLESTGSNSIALQADPDNLGASTYLGFGVDGTERARIDSSGYLLINQTSNVTSSYLQIKGAQPAISCESTSTGSVSQVLFRNPNGQVGSIGTSGTSTSYNTSSDYRLKEQVQPMTGALAKVAALKPVTYKWTVDGSDGQGFIAHELAEVVPDAVVGEKDAVEEDGSIKPQGIDTSFLVATLTAAIQEQQALIESLTARIAALEAA